MTVYYCEKEWDAMLTCIYEAFSSKKGHKNIRLHAGDIEQYNMFEEYIEVKADEEKAYKVMNSINTKISPLFYERMAYCAMSSEEDAFDNVYRMLVLGFYHGHRVVNMMQYEPVMRNSIIYKKYLNEVHHFREFIRFHELSKGFYIAHIEPKSNVVVPLGEDFKDRMPSENFMIIDDIHSEAIVHKKDENCYLRKLSQDELATLMQTEEINDEYTNLWRVFFNAIAIRERKNEACQNNLFPKWTRKHAVEFVN